MTSAEGRGFVAALDTGKGNFWECCGPILNYSFIPSYHHTGVSRAGGYHVKVLMEPAKIVKYGPINIDAYVLRMLYFLRAYVPQGKGKNYYNCWILGRSDDRKTMRV